MGSGKTLTMVWLAQVIQQSGKRLKTNFDVSFPHTKISKQDIINYGKGIREDIRDTLICLDEVQTLLDCRTSNKNRVVTYFILMTRKSGIDLIYTSQQFFNVEKRLRENTDIILECHPVYLPKRENGKKILKYIDVSVIDYHGRETFRLIRKFKITPCEALYKLYDTYQIINYDDQN
jgi:hypothetical protein